MHIRALLLILLGVTFCGVTVLRVAPHASAQQQQQQQSQQTQPQRLVENVTITGLRRNRQDAILYYIQTRAGDTYNPRQVESDLQTLLSLNFFDKTKSRVTVEDGERGGVNVIFEVTELPVIRQLQFEGLKSISESDVLKAFREKRVGVSKEAIYDPVKVQSAKRVIRELLAAKGHPNATVDNRNEEVSATSTAITFVVNEGERVRVVDVQFEGNQVFGSGELRKQMVLVKEAGLISRFRGQDILDREKLEYDLNKVTNYMRSKGYLQARTGEPRIEGVGRRQTGFFIPLPFLSSTDEGLRITIPITEGKIYRIGKFDIEGNSIFSEQQIQAVVGLKPGDIANGEKISKAFFENLKKLYGSQGFIEYSTEIEPSFKDNPQNPQEGIADFKVAIDEGKQFTLRRLEFLGNTFTRDNVLRREVLINEGDIYSQSALEYSIVRLNQLGYFEPLDEKKDVDLKTDEEQGLVDTNIKVVEKGRQQIAFNGGVSGIGGTFFGLNYSTNNLLGRGESLSFDFAFGNRQRSFQFSFTEPYIRNRPITAGFSIFTFSQKFFGEGTALSQNLAAQQGLFGTALDFFNTNEENLFTQTSTGGSLFLSAPLSEFYRKRPFTQFSRIGLSYQISQSSVKEPAVNAQNNPNTFIPVLYNQPNILTSRVTGSFVYDSRRYTSKANPTDPTSGSQLSFSLGLSGLGGDVRTYAPSASYLRFFPVRRKGGDNPNPEVFGFRILALNIGTFATTAKIRNANSLAFIDGIPVYERFFLGGEDSIRGYNVRSISPIVPLDTFITSRNVTLGSNATGAIQPVPGLAASVAQQLAQVGAFTGTGGANSFLVSRQFTSGIGGDTQLLGNFEYRIPLFGPVSLAAFADIGTVFNIRKQRDQFINSTFQTDEPFIRTLGFTSTGVPINLSVLSALKNPQLALVQSRTNGLDFGLVLSPSQTLATSQDITNAINGGTPVDPNTNLPVGFQPVFVRGEAQTNTDVRLTQSVFSKLGDYRASIGGEIRIQVPVVNVPFRLIYAYNPNARRGFLQGLPFEFNSQNEPKSVFRFSVGRTF
jgi:outer membrane protein insertion porin family